VSGGKIALLVFSCLPVLYVFWQKTKCAILAVAFYSIFFRLCYAVSFFLMQGNGWQYGMKRIASDTLSN